MKLYYLFIFILSFNIIFNQADDDYDPNAHTEQDDINICTDTESYEPCQERILTGGRLCCDIHESTADSRQESCEVKTTKEEQMKIVGSSHLINKELGGLAIYNKEYGGASGISIDERKSEVQRTISIECKTWQFTVDIVDGEEYTQDDIKILESENHCLTYFEPILKHIGSNRRNVTRDICYNASLLKSTEDAGISCGYMEIYIIEPHAVEKRETCFLYDPNVASNKILDEATRLNLNALSKKTEDENINYNYTIYSRDGSGYIYDSKTGIVNPIQDDPSFNNNNNNNNDEDLKERGEEEGKEVDKEKNETDDNYGIINKSSIRFIILIILFLL